MTREKERAFARPSPFSDRRKQVKITLITVGKIKEKYLKDAIAEYSKRLSRYCKLELVEVADEKTPDQAGETLEEQIREKVVKVGSIFGIPEIGGFEEKTN